jgi:8-amino-7-oxononanoate synthase
MHPADRSIDQKTFWSQVACELDGLANDSLARSLRPTEHLSPTHIIRDGKKLLHFASNDYLGLAWHPSLASGLSERVSEKSDNGIYAKYPSGATASPLILGATLEYDRLCQSIARWQNTEKSVVFSSGYAANLGTLRALVTPDDVLFSDSLNHACLIDACKLSRAKVLVYPHANCDALESLLKTHRQAYRMAWILTDSIFSMEGDIAPILEIEELARAYQAIPLADEAHASGVVGERGKGLLDFIGADPALWIKTGTLSKAVGSVGGFVAGPELLCRLIVQRARTLIFSTALPPNTLASCSQAIEILQTLDDERRKLQELSKRLVLGLRDIGGIVRVENPHEQIPVQDSAVGRENKTSIDEAFRTPIIPMYVESPRAAIGLSRYLETQGIYVPAIRPPTVPVDRCLLRVSLNAHHRLEHVQSLLQSLQSAPPQLDT